MDVDGPGEGRSTIRFEHPFGAPDPLVRWELQRDGGGYRLRLAHTEDRRDPNYLEATERFSAKDWRTVAWTDAQIDDEAAETTTVRG
ncbi:MAG: hypothetical protein H0T70_10290 [Acidimicrobiia bacterium]|nr:hypothetical protein [Acidimicrobiia bacterium]